jgi:hypothetical protein
MRSSERPGLPLKGRPHAKAVWVDLAVVFGQANGARSFAFEDIAEIGGLLAPQLVAESLPWSHRHHDDIADVVARPLAQLGDDYWASPRM